MNPESFSSVNVLKLLCRQKPIRCKALQLAKKSFRQIFRQPRGQDFLFQVPRNKQGVQRPEFDSDSASSLENMNLMTQIQVQSLFHPDSSVSPMAKSFNSQPSHRHQVAQFLL